MNIVGFILFLLIGITFGQYIMNRTCPNDHDVIKDFNVDKYIGKWYEIRRYEQPYEKNGECASSNLSWIDDKHIKMVQCFTVFPNKTQKCINGTAILSYPDRVPLEGKINASFISVPKRSNFWILDTDYINFSVGYGCKDLENGQSGESAWVFSRNPQLNPEFKTRVDDIINKYFVVDEMLKVKQKKEECNY